jgi:hypothetical protein
LFIAFLTGELSAFYMQLTSAPASPSLTGIPFGGKLGRSTAPPINAEPSALSPLSLALVLAGNGFLAFMLNVSSFSANKFAGALTMTVCANVKQCLTVLLGIVLFGVRVGVLNGFGMVIALAGAACYSAVELAGKKA